MVFGTGRGRIFRGEVDCPRCFGREPGRVPLPSEVVHPPQCLVRLLLYRVAALFRLGGSTYLSWSVVMKNRNNLWIFLFLSLLVLWSFYEIYPPTSRPLTQEFLTRAVNRDVSFTNILQRLQALQQAGTNSEFANLQEAVGTNNLQPYFPFFDAKNELYPNTFILNQLQRDASGKIKLGLDLQGGTSFLVEMDTNRLAQAQEGDTNQAARAPDTSGALSQAV